MLKKQEIDNIESCLNKAAVDEPLFVLRGKDICAADTVREWTRARVRAGKNHPQDKQILEALAIADAMQDYAAKRAGEEREERTESRPVAAWPFPTGSRP